LRARSHCYRRESGVYYFRWPIPQILTDHLRLPNGAETRFSLRTFFRRLALELAAIRWLRCRQLLTPDIGATALTDLSAAMLAFIKGAAVTSTQLIDRPPMPELVSLVDCTASFAPDILRPLVSYLVSKHVELFVQTPGQQDYAIYRREYTAENPSGTWEFHDVWHDYFVEHASVPGETFASLYRSDGSLGFGPHRRVRPR
jgi:hypothetical protein